MWVFLPLMNDVLEVSQIFNVISIVDTARVPPTSWGSSSVPIEILSTVNSLMNLRLVTSAASTAVVMDLPLAFNTTYVKVGYDCQDVAHYGFSSNIDNVFVFRHGQSSFSIFLLILCSQDKKLVVCRPLFPQFVSFWRLEWCFPFISKI